MGCEAIEKYYVKKSKIRTSHIGSREDLPHGEDYIQLPSMLDNHRPFGELDVSYEALQ